jgi:hypothetical protein
MKKSGFKTIGISTIGNISRDFGFGKGFENFFELYKDQTLREKRAKLSLKEGDRKQKGWRIDSDDVPICTSEDINQYLFPLLHENGNANSFIFVWSMDTHSPYFHRDPDMARSCAPSDAVWSPMSFLKKYPEQGIQRLKSLYEDMIYYNDYHMGALIEKLKDLGLFEQTLFILTSDHGESFNEHGVISHRTIPYDELIKIPLIIKFPHSQFIGKVDGLVQQIDLAPTILDYLDIPENDMLIQGKSFLPLLREQREVNDFVFSEFQWDEKLPKFVTLRTLDYKYMEARPGKFSIQRSIMHTLSPLVRSVFKQRYLFCLKEAGEDLNIIRQEKMIAKGFQLEVKAILRRSAEISQGLRKVKSSLMEVDKDVARQLRTLGYFD